MYFQIIPDDKRKQGFTIPILASLDYEYQILRPGGVSPNYIIEFSDTVMGTQYYSLK